VGVNGDLQRLVVSAAPARARHGVYANVPATFAVAFTPVAGTVLGAATNQALQVTFTPTDAVKLHRGDGDRPSQRAAATPTITWANPQISSTGPRSATRN